MIGAWVREGEAMLSVEFSFLEELTRREVEVLKLVAAGLSAKEVAKELMIAPRTVERHIDHIRLKARARNRSHMVALAVRQGLHVQTL